MLYWLLGRRPRSSLFCPKVSRSFLDQNISAEKLSLAYEPLLSQKAPKVLSDSITWINTALMDFGIIGLSLRALIDFLKTALQNSNAAVRTTATKTLVTVKLFAGSSTFVSDAFCIYIYINSFRH